MSPRQELVHAFLKAHPSDAADICSELGPRAAAIVLSEAPHQDAAAVLGLMPGRGAAECAASMPAPSLADLLGHVTPRLGALLLRSAPGELRASVLGSVAPHRRSRIELQLRFPPGSIGELMDTEVSSYPMHWTLGRLREALAENPLPGPSYVYVVDEQSVLVGVVGRSEMDHADSTPLARLMRTPVESVYAYTSVDSILDHPGWTKHDRLPVTSAGGLFVGALRHRDLRQRRGAPAPQGKADLGEVLMTISQVWWEGMWTALDGLASGDGAREGR